VNVHTSFFLHWPIFRHCRKPLLLWRDSRPGPYDFSPQSFSPPSSFAPPHDRAVRARVHLRVDCLNGGGGFLGYVVSPPLWLAAQRTCTA
jgi:hypothetical protein